jgi:tetratricopeptide (TPR) repeat protein
MRYIFCALKTYYDLFGLAHTCSLEEIKSSFRDKVKKLHPDLSGDKDAAEKFRLLLAAYRTLTNPEMRAFYDSTMRTSRAADTFVYRDFLKERGGDKMSQAKLIFYDLLHDNGEDALDLYEKLLLREEFSLDLFMDREDFMDCAFMLAEEYERQGMYAKAFDLLVTIVRFERQKPYFRHFLEEVLIRLRGLANTRLARVLSAVELLSRYFPLLELGLNAKETAFYAKKIAQAYLAMGRADLAEDYFDKPRGRFPEGSHKKFAVKARGET